MTMIKEDVSRCWVLKNPNKDEFIVRSRSYSTIEPETFPNHDIARAITFDTSARASDWSSFQNHSWSGFVPFEVEITKTYRKIQ